VDVAGEVGVLNPERPFTEPNRKALILIAVP